MRAWIASLKQVGVLKKTLPIVGLLLGAKTVSGQTAYRFESVKMAYVLNNAPEDQDGNPVLNWQQKKDYLIVNMNRIIITDGALSKRSIYSVDSSKFDPRIGIIYFLKDDDDPALKFNIHKNKDDSFTIGLVHKDAFYLYFVPAGNFEELDSEE